MDLVPRVLLFLKYYLPSPFVAGAVEAVDASDQKLDDDLKKMLFYL